MIDNFNLISSLLKFDRPTDFYYIEVTKRKKENPDFKKSSKVVSRYMITSREELIDRRDEIIEDCKHHNARAYIRLNRRNMYSISLRSVQQSLKYIEEGQLRAVKDAFWKAAGTMNDEGKDTKTWIVDIDTKDESIDREIQLFINKVEPLGMKILANIPTKNGVHLITKPFNSMIFKNKYPTVDLHKDNPTILYIP